MKFLEIKLLNELSRFVKIFCFDSDFACYQYALEYPNDTEAKEIIYQISTLTCKSKEKEEKMYKLLEHLEKIVA